MKHALLPILILGAGIATASQSVGQPPGKGMPAFGVIETWLNLATAQQLIEYRKKFDAAELAAITEFDAALGPYRDVAAMSAQDYRNQRAGHEVRPLRDAHWISEQQRRAAPAWVVRNRKVDAAAAELGEQTFAAVRAFFDKQLEAGRIPRADYLRFTREIRTETFPPIRRRKWAGPAVYAFNGPMQGSTREYLLVLQQIRKLWQGQGSGARVVSVRPPWR
jgi:hypothetical protein